MDLSTTYMGLKLKNPLIISSSRITGELRSIEQCLRHGASAIVLKSIFEEQLTLQAESKLRQSKDNDAFYWFPEAKDVIVELSKEAHLEQYLKFVENAEKIAGDIPVIASINCHTAEGWPSYAKRIEEAGASALELNISIFPFNNSMTCDQIENRYVEIVKNVTNEVDIPVSVKLSPYFTNLCTIASNLVNAGVKGLVLFNRFFRPDIDVDTMKVITDDQWSTPEELNVPLRWIALMTGNNLNCDLVASTGVHYHTGVVKQLLAGAKAVQLCSTLYINGIPFIANLLNGLEEWMKQHKFENIEQFRGKALDYQTTEASFERIQYMKRNFE
jgi:dihydroorotate dehydrogenase (fumarate)